MGRPGNIRERRLYHCGGSLRAGSFPLGQAEIRRWVDLAGLCEEDLESNEKVEVVVGLVERCVTENARVALDQDEYTQRYNGLVSRYEAVKAQFG